MSEKEDGDEDRELLVKTRPKTKRPPLYKVLLINDDYTPMEFVVMILEKFFGLTNAQAFDIMITVHKKGLAVVGVFSYEVAETKVAQVMDCARQHQHPFLLALQLPSYLELLCVVYSLSFIIKSTQFGIRQDI